MGISDNSVRFTLRIPEELRDALQRMANDHHRSLNSEIIVILQKEWEEFEKLKNNEG